MSAGTVYEQKGHYAQYSTGGHLYSWWIKLPGAKPNYVEKLSTLKGATFVYGSDIRNPKADEETNGWPRQLSVNKSTSAAKRPHMEDLL